MSGPVTRDAEAHPASRRCPWMLHRGRSRERPLASVRSSVCKQARHWQLPRSPLCAALSLLLLLRGSSAQDQEPLGEFFHPLLGRVRKASYGAVHKNFLTPNNLLYAVGGNTVGQIGDGSTTSREIPVVIFNQVVDVSAGSEHTVFVREDGTAWATGRNDVGQLGDGTRTNRKFPRRAMGDVLRVAAGFQHCIFLKKDGSVWATGLNTYGQLGDGTRAQRLRPVKMSAIEGMKFIAVAAGAAHNIMLRNTSEVYACGNNDHGQFGDGSRLSSRVPAATGVTGVKGVKASVYYSLFTRTDGTEWATGLYEGGELGPKLTLSEPAPIVRTWETTSAYYPLTDRSTMGADLVGRR